MALILFFAFANILGALGQQIVSIDQGQLNGTISRSRDNKPFYAFYGIPYAEPPVGEFRFAAPGKPPSWQGIRNASTAGPVCLQPTSFISPNASFIGDEDCLYLNVFTPQINPNKLLPVLVYIHGGAFHVGSGDEKGPLFFMDKSVVMVSFNHRHGILGYLSANDDVIPGNYGLKDQVAALRWIKSNIAKFGGDPDSVTILGQSSGSVCVHLHTLSPLSKGLFHRAIMQSGSAISFWSHYDVHHTKHAFADLIDTIDCNRTTAVEKLSCLRALPAEQLVRTEFQFLMAKRIIIKFRPAIEKRKVQGAFMTQSPKKLHYQNTSIPWIIGFNSAEGSMETAMLLKKTKHIKTSVNRELTKILPYASHYKYLPKSLNKHNITTSLKNFYFKNGKATEKQVQNISNLFTDLVFGMPTLHAAVTYPGPKYLYYFDRRNNSIDIATIFGLPNTTKIRGSGHGAEMFSIFSNHHRHFKISPVIDQKQSQQIIGYWTNFITTGNPNSDDLPVWDQLRNNTEYLHIADTGITTKTGLLQDRYAFWKHLFQ